MRSMKQSQDFPGVSVPILESDLAEGQGTFP